MKKRNWHNGTCKILMVSSVILFWAAASGVSQANNLTYPAVKQRTPQKLELVLGNSRVIESPVPIGRASIANPEVADTVVLSGKQIYVIGKTVGVTNMTLWEKKTNQVFAVFDLKVSPDLNGLKEQLHRVLPNEGDIKLTANHEKVTLWGSVSDSTRLSKALALAEAYAPKKVVNLLEVGGVHQVMLDVRMVEMSRELIRRLGVNITAANKDGSSFGVSKLNNLTNIVPFEEATIAPNFPTGVDPFGMLLNQSVNALFRISTGSTTINTFIDSLKENRLVKVLAEPTLTTLSGKPASFLAGGEFPFPVPQSFAVTTIKFKKFGVGLSFKPTVLSDNKISLDVNPEVSELDFVNSVEISGFQIPSLTTRRASTSIELDDGQSFAIAGLIRENVREQISKYPFLGELPILGALFRSSSFKRSETELVIFVTVHLAKPLNVKNQTIPDFMPPNDYEFYINGQMEGGESQNSTLGSMDSKFSAAHQSGGVKIEEQGLQGLGLEGEFGEKNQLPAESLIKTESTSVPFNELEHGKSKIKVGRVKPLPLQPTLRSGTPSGSVMNVTRLGLDGEFGRITP
jgi:pilus assembly protein CpaC